MSRKKNVAIVAVSGIALYLIVNRHYVKLGMELQKQFPEYSPVENSRTWMSLMTKIRNGAYGDVEKWTNTDWNVAFLTEALDLHGMK